MYLDRLTRIKRWQIGHRDLHPVEYHAFDAILTGWVLGWIGLPSAFLLWPRGGIAICCGLLALPTAYWRLRRFLHRRRLLRCDWLAAIGV